MIQALVLSALAASSLAAHEPSALDENGIYYHEQSLVKPFFAGDAISIANWDFIGNAVVTDDYIRLTPDRQTKRGGIWALKPMPNPSWEMTTEFSVSGQGKSLFGDGFALWYTKEYNQLGSALGNAEAFTGIGIFFDTYDNHQEDHGHPWISAIINDGTKVYDHDEDGKSFTQGGCQSFFRNLDHNSHVRVTYWEDLKYLKVQVDTKEEDEWTDCFDLHDIHLPNNYHFGASASTGDLADNHDIISIKVGSAPVPSEELKKLVADKAAQAEKNIGSMEKAKEMNTHHMNQERVVSNHHERHPESASSLDDEGTSWFTIIIVLILIVGAVGGGVYFMNQKDTKKFDY